MSQYVDLTTRTIFIYGEIEEDMVLEISRALTDKGKWNVKINSEGGDLYSALALIIALKKCKKVNIDIVGRAHSAAAYIVLFGSYVQMSEMGSIMFHQTRWSTDSQTVEEHLQDVEEVSRITLAILSEGLKDTRINAYDIEKETKRGDYYMDSDAAVLKGIVNEVYS